MQQTERRALAQHSCIIFGGFRAQILARNSAILNEGICISRQSPHANAEGVS
jgi:hypothetical protein